MIATTKWTLIPVVGLLGFLLYYSCRGQEVWRERVKVLEEQVIHTDSLRARYARDSVQWIEQDSSLSQIASHASREAQRAKIALWTTLDSLKQDSVVLSRADTLSEVQLDALPQPVRVLIFTQAGYIQTARRALEQARGVQEGQAEEIGALRASQSGLRDRVASLETLKTRLTAERDSARVLLKPPSPFGLTFELGVGPGCAVNLGQAVCGLSVQATLLRFRFSR